MILVVAEQRDGQLNRVSWEAVAAAQKLAAIAGGAPITVVVAGGSLGYDQMATPEGLAQIATYADGVGPEKNHFLLPLDRAGRLDPSHATDFVQNAHRVGLKVHPYTFRAENCFLPTNHRQGTDPKAPGDLESELAIFLALGIDGFFTDQTDLGVRARDAAASSP